MPEKAYKLIVHTPESHSEALMDAIDSVMEPFYPGYRRCFSISGCQGTWVPEEGSHPYLGTIGEIETADEVSIEFILREKDLRPVLRKIAEVHPYEEPAIDVIPCFGWRSFL